MAAPVSSSPKFDVAISSNFGYVYTKKAAEEVKESHELENTLRFVSLKTSAHFGTTNFNNCKHRILWEEAQRSHGGKIEYDGIPYMHLNKNMYECEYGKDHKFKTKEKAKQARAEKRKSEAGNGNKARNLIQDTKKKDCRAKLVMKEVVKFPDFKIPKNTNYMKREAAQKVWDAIASGHANGERRIYIYLPEENEHEGHPVGKICGARQRVDHRIIEYIQRMVGTGVSSVSEMRLHIERFVSGGLFWGRPGPDLSNRRYFPEDSDIRYHMYSAEAKKKFCKGDQSNIEVKISEWQKEDPAQLFFYRKGAKKVKSEGSLHCQPHTQQQQQPAPPPPPQQQPPPPHHQQHQLPSQLQAPQQLPQLNLHPQQLQETQQAAQQLHVLHQQQQLQQQQLQLPQHQQLQQQPLQQIQQLQSLLSQQPPSSQQQQQQLPLLQQPLQQLSIQQQQEVPLPVRESEIAVTGRNSSNDSMLLVHQTAWQQYLLARYGNELCVLDATFRSTGCTQLLYFIVVKTNCDYQVVATFVTEESQQTLILEALNILKEWNPTWVPSYFMTDIATEDMNAVQQAFPGCSVYFCDYHRQYAWEHWMNSESNDIRNMKQNILSMLERIATASTEGEYYAAVVHLQGSQIWNDNRNLRNWLGQIWLPTHQRWVRAFRRQSFIKAINTSTGIGFQNKLFRDCCLPSDKQPKLTQLMFHILHRFLPKNKSAYFQSNSKADDGCRKYSDSIPAFLHKRPRAFLQSCLHQLKAAGNIRADHIKLIDTACFIFHVKTPSSNSPDPFTVNLMRPDCTCKIWDKTALPCKHMLAVLKHSDAWSWDSLPSSYTHSPFFNIDYDFVNKIVGKQPILPQNTCPDLYTDTSHRDHENDSVEIDVLETITPGQKQAPVSVKSEITAIKPKLAADSLPKKCHAVLARLHDKVSLVNDEQILVSVLAILQKTETAITKYVPKDLADQNDAEAPTPKRRRREPRKKTSQ